LFKSTHQQINGSTTDGKCPETLLDFFAVSLWNYSAWYCSFPRFNISLFHLPVNLSGKWRQRTIESKSFHFKTTVYIMLFKSFSKFLLASLFISAAFSLNAQQPTTPGTTQKQAKKEQRAAKKEQHYDKQAENLKLSEEQEAQFKKIDADYQSKIKTVRQENKAETDRLRDERRTAKRALLNAEQAEKFDQQYAKRQEKKAKKAGKKKQ
jgi:Spy/CpxP family protein refolding chaperone